MLHASRPGCSKSGYKSPSNGQNVLKRIAGQRLVHWIKLSTPVFEQPGSNPAIYHFISTGMERIPVDVHPKTLSLRYEIILSFKRSVGVNYGVAIYIRGKH